jgi:hypothetical protein
MYVRSEKYDWLKPFKLAEKASWLYYSVYKNPFDKMDINLFWWIYKPL